MIKFFVLLVMEILFLIALLFDRKKHREMSKFAKFFFLLLAVILNSLFLTNLSSKLVIYKLLVITSIIYVIIIGYETYSMLKKKKA